MTKKKIISIFIFLVFLSACTREKNQKNIISSMDGIEKISQEKWDTLANKKIYFGHQSVGYNMIDGIELILKENPNLRINIKKGHEIPVFKNPVLAHDSNGTNRDPKSKIDAFCNVLNKGLGDQVDIAGFKFCYVDFNKRPNYKEVFDYYKKRINEISIKYPNVKIIHFTVPIKSLQSGPKAFIKKLFGKDTGIRDNIVRQRFNNLLKKEYKGELIFDLARYESTYPDGSREFSLIDNEKIYAMVPTYTIDGGHLSNNGKITIGSQLLVFLSEISDGRNN